MREIVNLENAAPFITKDGSEIRELLAHRNSSIRNQSLAEARVPAGCTTLPHYHPLSEEIYFILEGSGRIWMREATSPWESKLVSVGDAIAIPPGTRHAITNVGEVPLRLLCCCAPGYEHTDTVLIEEKLESSK